MQNAQLVGLWERENCRTFAPGYQTQTIMAKIYVNGDAQEVSLPLNVSELIQQQNVLQPEMVSVQVNEEFSELPCRSTLLRQASVLSVSSMLMSWI